MWLNSRTASEFLKACASLPSGQRKRYPSKSVIYLTQPVDTIWVVMEGHVALSHCRPDGQRWMQRVVGRGGTFGAVLYGRNRESSPQQAIAHGAATVMQFERQKLEDVIRAESTWAAILLECLGARAETIEKRLLWPFQNPLRARVATILLDMMGSDGTRCRHGHAIDVRLTHQDLADLAGAARPVISGILSEFKSQGMIDYTRQFICIESPMRLRATAAA